MKNTNINGEMAHVRAGLTAAWTAEEWALLAAQKAARTAETEPGQLPEPPGAADGTGVAGPVPAGPGRSPG